MALLHGGPAFVWLVPLHRWSTYALIPLVIGHVVIASGVLPGYRGVWRSMHLGGRLPTTVARRVWPGWTERWLRASLGGIESLISLPVLTSQWGHSDEQLRAAGVTKGMLRLSVGLEDPADLISDLDQALAG
jgi:hypothetical protein